MIDLYYFKIIHYRVKQVIQPILIYKTSKAWDYKSYYSKENTERKLCKWSDSGGRIMWRWWLGCRGRNARDGCLNLSCNRLLRVHSLLCERRALWWNCKLWWDRNSVLRSRYNTQVVLYLPNDGSMLSLSDNNLLLMSMKSCHLLSKDALRSG